MIIQPSRRGFITGLVSLIAAPAIVRAESLMPVKSLKLIDNQSIWSEYIGNVLAKGIRDAIMQDVLIYGNAAIIMQDREFKRIPLEDLLIK